MGNSSSNSNYDEKTRALIRGMIDAEEKAIASRKKQSAPEEEECECKDGMFPNGKMSALASRRQFLTATATGAAALAVGNAASAAVPAGAIDYPVQDDPTKVQGRLTNDDGGYGSRSQFETESRWRFPTATIRPRMNWWSTGWSMVQESTTWKI
jgi:sulfane dehydrogenase subunit SoxC